MLTQSNGGATVPITYTWRTVLKFGYVKTTNYLILPFRRHAGLNKRLCWRTPIEWLIYNIYHR